jgi:hypothetical protein
MGNLYHFSFLANFATNSIIRIGIEMMARKGKQHKLDRIRESRAEQSRAEQRKTGKEMDKLT